MNKKTMIAAGGFLVTFSLMSSFALVADQALPEYFRYLVILSLVSGAGLTIIGHGKQR